MASYYDDFDNGAPRRPRRSVALYLADLLMGFVTVLTAAAMILTLLAPYVNPDRWWGFPVLGLAAPGVYLVTVVLALYWIVRWRWTFACVALVLVGAGLFKVTLFYKPEFKRYYGDPKPERGSFVLMTYNVRLFYDDEGESSAGRIARLIAAHKPDIVCLQEYQARLAEAAPEFRALSESYSRTSGGREHPDPFQCIWSKYPILGSGTLDANASIWADLLIGEDTLRVYCNHLHSTTIKSADDAFITRHEYLSDTAREVKLRSIVQRFRASSVRRAVQVDSIARAIGEVGGPKIVCGDFNDTPMSYVYRTMADGLTDAFRACGRGYSHTFRGFYDALRIDYVLVSPQLEPLTYEVPDEALSDHLPVIVRLKMRRN